MLFNTRDFLLFFTVVFAIYWYLPRQQLRVWFLILASIYFYATWSKWLALLVVSTTIMDFLLAIAIENAKSSGRKKLLLATSLGVNLGILCVFKYMNFFLDSLHQAFSSVGYNGGWTLLNVIVPFGISFYTFEAISYTIDVYRGRTKAERKLSSFMLFILFFPHLVAGPIVRAYDFLPQTHRDKRFNWLRMQVGVQHFLLGMFLKVAIGDRMAYFVEPIFGDPRLENMATWMDASKYNTSAIWLAVVAFMVQIYTDFAGYSHMAIGTAHMLGYRLTKNFDMPYSATNIQQFWHKWHISLSTWFRDYVFIPLGGSRGSFWFVARNLLIVFTLSGLWHGANWTFIIWGALHGLLLIGYRVWQNVCQARPALSWYSNTWAGQVGGWMFTMFSVMLLWVFFRACSLEAALNIFQRMFVPSPGQGAPLHNRSFWYTVAILAIGHFLMKTELWKRLSPRVPAPALGFGYASLLTLTLLLAPDSSKAFIYFQF